MRAVAFAALALFPVGAGLAVAKESQEQPWVRHQVSRSFSIELPASLRRKAVRGIDSEVAEYRGAGLSVHFDLGWYGAPADCARAKICSTSPVTIDGHSGWLEVREEETGMHFHANLMVRRSAVQGLPPVSLSATVNCWAPATCEQAPHILPTIKFAPADAIQDGRTSGG
jgi:hypothetical protein